MINNIKIVEIDNIVRKIINIIEENNIQKIN